MASDHTALRRQVDAALSEGRPADAVCYLAELCAQNPDDRHTRTALAIALGDAGFPVGALKVLRATANHLAHKGYLLPAIVIVRHGLKHARNDPGLIATLKRLHVRGVRAKAGNLPIPPPLKPRDKAVDETTAEALLALNGQERLERATEIGCDFGPQGEAAIPLPLPLFSELDEEGFVETVQQLHFKRLAKGTELLTEGQIGDHLLVIASGHVNILKGGNPIAKVGPGTVLGEMALITGAPRSATAIADEEVEVFQLNRTDVEALAKQKPKIAEELIEYCRKRLIGNLLRTSPLFARFDDATRYGLIDQFQRLAFNPGQKLIEQGKPGTGLFVIATGEVQVSIAKDDGPVTVLANLGPGQVIGEMSLIQNKDTNATVTAAGRVGALFLPLDAFNQVLASNADARDYLTTLTADRLQAHTDAEEIEILDADDLIIL